MALTNTVPLNRPESELDRLLDRVADVCPFPAAAQRLMTLVADESSSISAIATTVASDPALATQVLRIANSAAFRRSGSEPVGDLRQAVVTIGVDSLRTLAGATALLASFATRDELSLDLQARSAVCGSIAIAVAGAQGGGQGAAFICGLLSEVGGLACIAVDGPGYLELRQRKLSVDGHWSVNEAMVREQLEAFRYGVPTRTIGARLLRRHHLPEEIAQAVDASPWQPPRAPLLLRATAFARLAAPLVIASHGAADPALAHRIVEIACACSVSELDSDELVQRCIEAADRAERMLRVVRN